MRITIENRLPYPGSVPWHGIEVQNSYVDGTGTLPTSTTQLRVTGTPGAPGETHTITFQARGVKAGTWTNYAFMTSSLFQGVAAAFFGGQVTR